jgi:hypothetical protein
MAPSLASVSCPYRRNAGAKVRRACTHGMKTQQVLYEINRLNNLNFQFYAAESNLMMKMAAGKTVGQK